MESDSIHSYGKMFSVTTQKVYLQNNVCKIQFGQFLSVWTVSALITNFSRAIYFFLVKIQNSKAKVDVIVVMSIFVYSL